MTDDSSGLDNEGNEPFEAAQLSEEATKGICAGIDVAVSVATMTGTPVTVGGETDEAIFDGEVVAAD